MISTIKGGIHQRPLALETIHLKAFTNPTVISIAAVNEPNMVNEIGMFKINQKESSLN